MALPVISQTNEIGVWYSSAKIKNTGDTTEGRLTFDNAKGGGVSFNHFFGSLSTELAVQSLRANGGIDVSGTRLLSVGRMKIMPVTANVQWHLARGSMFSPYVGAGVAYIKTSDISSADLDLAGIGTIKVDKKTTWDANAGVDIGIGRMFAIAVDGKYFKYEPTATANGTSQKLKLNPLSISAGLKLRW
ncbi:MAG TPA: OmpW family outer membrane protein [Thermoanaerobaculia bacterium]